MKKDKVKYVHVVEGPKYVCNHYNKKKILVEEITSYPVSEQLHCDWAQYDEFNTLYFCSFAKDCVHKQSLHDAVIHNYKVRSMKEL